MQRSAAPPGSDLKLGIASARDRKLARYLQEGVQLFVERGNTVQQRARPFDR